MTRPTDRHFAANLAAIGAAAFLSAASPAHADDFAQRSPDIHWPAGFTPRDADLFAHDEIMIGAPCERIWRHILEAAKWPSWYSNAKDVRIGGDGVLHADSHFIWNTFGLEVDGTVHEFVPSTRIGWFGTATDLRAYHTWYLAPVSASACQVITEEVGKGPAAVALRASDPDAMHRGHDLWLTSLKSLSER
jgi:hypothetical protein